MTWSVIEGNCVKELAQLAEASVDAVVCDPPYGLEFMGKEWDRFDSVAANTSGPQTTMWHANGGQNPYARGATPRYAGKKLGNKTPEMHAFQMWSETWARETLRVLKPGGYLLAFGGTRTYHRLACAVEDAGFEIRDEVLSVFEATDVGQQFLASLSSEQLAALDKLGGGPLAWMYGQGFPKSLNVSKVIDKAAGAEREVVGDRGLHRWSKDAEGGNAMKNDGGIRQDFEQVNALTAPATPEAVQWEGWGTALKPSHEPIVVARKPLVGTVAENVVIHGTGALNIDGCRIGSQVETWPASRSYQRADTGAPSKGTQATGAAPAGRWPANVVLDKEAAAMLDEQSGELTSGARSLGHNRVAPRLGHGGTYGDHAPSTAFTAEGKASRGGASRFFYTAKVSAAEREAGLLTVDRQFAPTMGNGIGGKEHDPQTATPKRNIHPTVKPIDLMRWLVRLVTPTGGTVLDPFVGSGSTGCAAVLEGFDFIGIERQSEYAEIARARIAFWAAHPTDLPVEKALESQRQQREARDTGQIAMDL